MTYEELREKIAEEVGYTHVPKGYADTGKRVYGTCNDAMIELCHKFMSENNLQRAQYKALLERCKSAIGEAGYEDYDHGLMQEIDKAI